MIKREGRIRSILQCCEEELYEAWQVWLGILLAAVVTVSESGRMNDYDSKTM